MQLMHRTVPAELPEGAAPGGRAYQLPAVVFGNPDVRVGPSIGLAVDDPDCDLHELAAWRQIAYSTGGTRYPHAAANGRSHAGGSADRRGRRAGPDTVYPVRAHRFVGAGYELVDASSQYDLVLHRDVYGAVARQFWGDRLYGRHPHGIRITLIDPEAPPECAIVCKSCPGQPTIARHLAPIRLSNDWRGDCHARSLSASYGDGQGATIWVGCAHDSDAALGVQTDPEECFVTIAAPGPHLTDLLVSATITTLTGWWCRTTTP